MNLDRGAMMEGKATKDRNTQICRVMPNVYTGISTKMLNAQYIKLFIMLNYNYMEFPTFLNVFIFFAIIFFYYCPIYISQFH